MDTEENTNEDCGKDSTPITPTISNLTTIPCSNTVIKRPKNVDISKFNHSNRKSKNCAIFYFKHLDTDSEQRGGGLSSQGSDVSSVIYLFKKILIDFYFILF